MHDVRPVRLSTRRLGLCCALAAALLAACAGAAPPTPDPKADTGLAAADVTSDVPGPGAARPVQVVLFTHIEDNVPSGTLGTPVSRANYLTWRERLLHMAELAKSYSMTWVLQPDWKILVAAQEVEDAAVMATTGGKNIFRYLRDDYGVVIDAHAHESGDYNYPDVAYLLTALGVGGTTVIGGHVWDPNIKQFGHWERFRAPVAGKHFPEAIWRGDILMGAGTPGHTNDPIVSGVWRPKDPLHFFTDDPAGNIASVGAFRNDLAGITVLSGVYSSGKVNDQCILTSTFHITPAMIESSATLATLEADVLKPLKAMRTAGAIEITDFTSLYLKWKLAGSVACVYQE